jgi:hypothetical protein
MPNSDQAHTFNIAIWSKIIKFAALTEAEPCSGFRGGRRG